MAPDTSPSQRTRPRSARIDDLMTVRVLAHLIGGRSIALADVQTGLPLRKSYINVMNTLEAAGVVERVPSTPKRPLVYTAAVPGGELARRVRRAVARVERAEGGAA